MVRILRLLVLAVFLTALLYAQLHLTPYVADDAFIHFRIVENFLNTGYPYFNHGEPVLATSSLPWTLLLTVLFYFLGSSLKIVAASCALCTFISALLWSKLIRRTVPQLSLISEGISFLAFLAALAPASFQLMESSLALLFLALALLLYDAQKPLAFLFFTLAAFTRLELTVFLLLFGALALRRYYYQQQFRKILAALGYLLAVALPLLFFLWHYFRAFLPHTITAKEVVYHVSPGDFIQILGRAYLNEFSPELTQPLLILFAVSLLFFVGAILLEQKHFSFRQWLQQYGTLVPSAAAGALILATYFFKAVFLFPWYLPLFFVPLLALALATFARQPHLLQGGLVFALSALLVYNLARDCYSAVEQPEQFSAFLAGARVRKYLELGTKLQQLFPQARVMAAEIGGLGYNFHGKILDGCGLVSPPC